MNSTYLLCREAGHVFLNFAHVEVIQNRGRLVSYKRVSSCIRCTTKRIQHIDGGTFAVLQNSYQYPEGYIVKGERITRRDARRALFG